MSSETSGEKPHHEHGRSELDPIASDDPTLTSMDPAETAEQRRADDEIVQSQVESLVRTLGADHLRDDGDADFKVRLVRELVTAGLKLIPDGRDTGELKLMTAALKELRYAYRVFGAYPDPHKVTIFGSARTPEDHPDFESAVRFGKLMADAGWMAITGAGDGIMKAGHVGPGRESSFGVAIRLPFETTANDVIAGDDKLIHFRYFFTRKLMFLSQSEAVALFPGGFGTMDEAYETLTLVQTGKASIIPIVLVEHDGGNYWTHFHNFVRKSLLEPGLISPEDLDLYYHAESPEDACDHICRFYRVYHSSRYVRNDLVIRIRHRISDRDIAALNEEFASLVAEGKIHQREAYDIEGEHEELPRIAFTHTRNHFGLVRRLIDRINGFDPA